MPQARGRPGKAATLAAELRDAIVSGRYAPGQKLPKFRELVENAPSRSKATVDAALKMLQAEGLLDVVHGSGIYVRQREVVRRDLIADLRSEYSRALAGDSSGGLFESATHRDATVEADHAYIAAAGLVAERLSVDVGAPLLVRRFRYVLDSGPYQIAQFYWPADLADLAGLPATERKGLGSIAHLLTAGVQVDEVSIDVEARMPTGVEVAELDMPPGTPILDHWRILRAGGVSVEVGNIAVRGDRVASTVKFQLKEISE